MMSPSESLIFRMAHATAAGTVTMTRTRYTHGPPVTILINYSPRALRYLYIGIHLHVTASVQYYFRRQK